MDAELEHKKAGNPTKKTLNYDDQVKSSLYHIHPIDH